MTKSPSAISSILGRSEPFSAMPTPKPTKSKPVPANTPGSSAMPASRNLQPASRQPSETLVTSWMAWCASSFSIEKCSWKNNGLAPRAAMSLTQSATTSIPKVLKSPTVHAIFSFVPRALAPLTKVQPSAVAPIWHVLPRTPTGVDVSSSPAHVLRSNGSKLLSAASHAALSTPAARYVNSHVSGPAIVEVGETGTFSIESPEPVRPNMPAG
mmetsp:Transcript_102720/g.296951  ORF Transcript_102720/g.296951 Transcript_102720/m.296951 type:complete len:212 (+) Transcript_102720:1482-2117(+)